MTLAEKLKELIDLRDSGRAGEINYRDLVAWAVERCEVDPDEGFALAYINLLGLNITQFVNEVALVVKRVPNSGFATKLNQLHAAIQYGVTEEVKLAALGGPTRRFFEAMVEIGHPIRRHPNVEGHLRLSGLDLDTLPWASE